MDGLLGKSTGARALLGGILAILLGTSALADPVGCERGTARASMRYVQRRVKALGRCEIEKTNGTLRPSTDCTNDPRTARTLASARARLIASIVVACGGPNRSCGDTNDVPLADVGWNRACPDFGAPSCARPIADCADVAVCIACIDDAGIDHALATVDGAFDSSAFHTGDPVNGCQQAIAGATVEFLAARAKILQHCWDARLKGQHQNACPDPGDGRAAGAIANAEMAKVASICKACGGGNPTCAGSSSIPPSQIGFVPSCPAVTPLGSAGCGGSVVTTSDVVACVDCVATFDGDCIDAAAVPTLVGDFPASCRPTTTTTATTTSLASSTTTSSTTSSTSTTTTSTIVATSTTTTTTTATTTSTMASCTPVAGSSETFTVAIAIPAGAEVQGVTVLLDYPELQVNIPGSGNATSVKQSITVLQSGTISQPNDMDFALRETVASLQATLSPGPLFRVNFQACQGATPPTAADFGCTVEIASDPFGNGVEGVTCSVSAP